MKSITAQLDRAYTPGQRFDKTYNNMDHIDSARSVEYQAIGSNTYSANTGAKVVKFRLSDDRAWLDPSTVRIQYKIKNKFEIPAGSQARENLYPLKAHGFFSRMRIMSRGSLIEDIGDYNRVHEMFQNLRSDNKTIGEFIEGYTNNMILSLPTATDDTNPLDYFTKTLPGNEIVVPVAP